jgi:hypothetical protein
VKSLRNFGRQAAGIPVLADDVLEFHAARLLLLFKVCGIGGRIDGLTKMAKLDFFVRYPQFFDEVCGHLGKERHPTKAKRAVESSMIRFHYGPWDSRYYHILGYLEAKSLIKVERDGRMYKLKLTDAGKSIAKQTEKSPAYANLVQHMETVKDVLGSKAGSTLKDLVYKVFGEEVADRALGEVIQ